MKLAQRLGLAFLPPREAAWRHRQGHASLGHTLGAEGLSGASLQSSPVYTALSTRAAPGSMDEQD